MSVSEDHTNLQIVAIGRNYADHAKELGNAIPKGQYHQPQLAW
jgi:2-keto-4-pentenoate hydratase/2-oxohepta-3-ene-1,7-dioic acid hydratase in catechol pathway